MAKSRKRGRRGEPPPVTQSAPDLSGDEDDDYELGFAELERRGLTKLVVGGPWHSAKDAMISAALERPIAEQSREELRLTARLLVVSLETLGNRMEDIEAAAEKLARRRGAPVPSLLMVRDDHGTRRAEIEIVDGELVVSESVDGGESWEELPLKLSFWGGVKNLVYNAWPPGKVLYGWYLGADVLQLLVEGRLVDRAGRANEFLATFSQRSRRWTVGVAIPFDDGVDEPERDGNE